MTTVLIQAAAAMVLGGILAQAGPVPAPPGAPVGGEPAQLSTASKLSVDSSVEQILEALERRGVGLRDFTADVTLEEQDATEGRKTIRKGTAVYQKKEDGGARMRVVFNSVQRGKKIVDQKLEYLLDNGWLVDRDYERKVETKRQVMRPGEKIDLLKLGEGPFPLPVGQPPAKVLEMFDVKKVPPAADAKDPADTVHILLTPRPDTRFAKKFKTIDVWVDVKTAMPRQIRTLSADEQQERTTDLDMKGINAGLKDADFTLDPVGEGWDMSTEKYED